MKSPLVLALTSPLLLAAAFSPSPAHAAVVWMSDFETGQISEFGQSLNATKGTRQNIEFVMDPVQHGKLACKIVIHPDDNFQPYDQNRVEMHHVSTLTGEGMDNYFSGWYLMPADIQVRNQIGYWETTGTSQNIMDFWVEPKPGGGTTINFGTGFLGAMPRWKADFTLNKWHQLAMHVHWSQNAQMGKVSIWFDGVQVVNEVTAKTKPDGNALFYQTGFHRSDPQPFTETIFLDNFVEGTTLADVLGPPPSDGGTVPNDASRPDGSGGSASDAGASAGGAGGAGGSGGASVGGSGGTGGNGGAATTGTGGSAGTDVAGAGGATGTTGAGGTAQTGGSANATTSGGNPGSSKLDSGCSCSIGRTPANRFAAFSALVGAALALSRRRRRVSSRLVHSKSSNRTH